MSIVDYRQPNKGERIEQRVQETCRQVKRADIFLSLIVLLTCCIAYLFLFILLDHWCFKGGASTSFRIGMFALGLVAITLYSVRRLLPLFRYSVNPVYAAKMLESLRPTMKNSLINWIFLRKEHEDHPELKNQNPLQSRIIDGVATRTLKDLDQVPEEMVVDRRPAVRWGLIFIALLGSICVYALLSPKSPFASLARFAFPFADISTPTRVRFLEIQPGDAKVFQGEHLTISAHVAGVRNEPVHLYYTTEDQRLVDQIVPLSIPENGFKYECRFPPGKSGFEQGLKYFLKIGEDRSRTFQIQVLPPMNLEVRSLTYKYPSYTGEPDATVHNTGDIRALQGSEVLIDAKSNFPMERAWYVPDGEEQSGRSLKIGSEKNSANLSLWLIPDPNQPEKGEVQSYVLRGYDSEGNTNRNPSVYRVEILKDQPPKISWVDPPQEQLQIPLNGYTESRISAEDADFGIRYVRVHFDVQGKKIPPLELLNSPKDGPTRYSGTVNIGAMIKPEQLQLDPGDAVEYWAEVVDTRLPEGNAAITDRLSFLVLPPKAGADKKDANPEQQERKEQEEEKKQSESESQESEPGDSENQGESENGEDSGSQTDETDDSSNGENNGSENGPENEESGKEENGDGSSESSQDGTNSSENPQSDHPSEQDSSGSGKEGNQKPEDGTGTEGSPSPHDQQGEGEEENGETGKPQDNEGEQENGNSSSRNSGDQGAKTNESGSEGKSGDSGEQSADPSGSGNETSSDDRLNQGFTPDPSEENEGGTPEKHGADSPDSQNSPGNEGDSENPSGKKPEKSNESGGSGKETSSEDFLDGEADPGEVLQRAMERMKELGKETDPDKVPESDKSSEEASANSENRTDQGTPPDQVPDKTLKEKPGEKTQSVYKEEENRSGTDAKRDADPDKPVLKDPKVKDSTAPSTENFGSEGSSDSSGEQSGESQGNESSGGEQPGGGNQPGGEHPPGGEQSEGQDQSGSEDQSRGENPQSGDGAQSGNGAPSGDGAQSVGENSGGNLSNAEGTPGSGEGTSPGQGGSAQDSGKSLPGQSGASEGNQDGEKQGQGGGGGEQSGPSPSPLPPENTKKDPTLEQREKQAALILRYLEEEMSKSEPDPKLLEKFKGWSRDDLKSFIENWKKMSEDAKKAAPGSSEDKDWKELMKSIGPLSPGKRTTTGPRKNTRDRAIATGTQRVAPPSHLKDRADAYNIGIAK